MISALAHAEQGGLAAAGVLANGDGEPSRELAPVIKVIASPTLRTVLRDTLVARAISRIDWFWRNRIRLTLQIMAKVVTPEVRAVQKGSKVGESPPGQNSIAITFTGGQFSVGGNTSGPTPGMQQDPWAGEHSSFLSRAWFSGVLEAIAKDLDDVW